MISFDRKSGGAEEAHCFIEEMKTQKLTIIWSMLRQGRKNNWFDTQNIDTPNF